jgi:hypothetical protein
VKTDPTESLSPEQRAEQIMLQAQVKTMANEQVLREMLDKYDLDRPVMKMTLVFVLLALVVLAPLMGASPATTVTLLSIIVFVGLMALNKRITALVRLHDLHQHKENP